MRKVFNLGAEMTRDEMLWVYIKWYIKSGHAELHDEQLISFQAGWDACLTQVLKELRSDFPHSGLQGTCKVDGLLEAANYIKWKVK